MSLRRSTSFVAAFNDFCFINDMNYQQHSIVFVNFDLGAEALNGKSSLSVINK